MSEDDAPTDTTPTEDDSRPPVACTVSEERAAERADWMADELLPAYAGYDEREDGVIVRFDGATETLQHVARFVAEEQECCSFADYRIEVTPPYGETRLTITGPEGTREMFAEEFIGRLGGAVPPEPPQ